MGKRGAEGKKEIKDVQNKLAKNQFKSQRGPEIRITQKNDQLPKGESENEIGKAKKAVGAKSDRVQPRRWEKQGKKKKKKEREEHNPKKEEKGGEHRPILDVDSG